MDEQKQSTADEKGQRTCPECGAIFTCGIAAGHGTCWCFALPRTEAVPDDPDAPCLCPECLVKRIGDA